VEPGQQVKAGDTLFILESMKMEIPIEASEAGTVSRVFVEPGSPVNAGDLLAGVRA